MTNYKFETGCYEIGVARRLFAKPKSDRGIIEAADWSDACQKLEAMLSDTAIDAGGWGWVEDTDGFRYAINCEGDESRGL